ncbi:MAG: response regulator transcription factor [Chloroflexi bacterium]|nr:response regulator transcription factor [Chloroflexota bacterium]
MKHVTILIVDDEPKIVRFIKTSLNLAGYDLLIANDGQTALEVFEQESPDLVVLDLGLPDIDGFDVLQRIRQMSTVPILILTARDDEKDKVRGLELGADDYLTKPFGIREMEARIQAVLRRIEWAPQSTDPNEFELRDLMVDFRRRKVTIGDEEKHLTPTEYELLRALIQHAGQVLVHSDLLTRVWGEEYRNDLAILRVNISRLRQKIEVDARHPTYVLTVPGVGYMLSTD